MVIRKKDFYRSATRVNKGSDADARYLEKHRYSTVLFPADDYNSGCTASGGIWWWRCEISVCSSMFRSRSSPLKSMATKVTCWEKCCLITRRTKLLIATSVVLFLCAVTFTFPLIHTDWCSWLLMMGRQTRSHCQIQCLATNPAGPNGWFLGIPPVAIPQCVEIVNKHMENPNNCSKKCGDQEYPYTNPVDSLCGWNLWTFRIELYKRGSFVIFSMLDDQIQGFSTSTWATAAALLFQNGNTYELPEVAFGMILLHFLIYVTLQEKPATK